MKKLMIAAAIVCAAAMAQAGKVNWSAMNIQGSSAVTTFTEDTTYIAYLFIGSDVSDATKLLVGDTKDFEAFESKALTSRTEHWYEGDGNYISFYAQGDGDFKSTDVSAYMIVLDAANIDDAKNYQVMKVGGDGAEVITQTFGTSGNKPYAWGDQTSNTWTAMSVPEPTSGLLLLLGVAGLALKRRRA